MTIMWYMVLEIWSSPDFFVILSHFLPSYPLTARKMKISKKKKKKKMKKRPKKLGDIITLQKCTKNHDHRLYCSWDMAHYRCNYFSIWAILLPFMPLTAQKMKISKKWKKMPRDVIILHKCNKNHDHMLYCSWDMACDGCDCYFSFWAIFCP